MLRQNGSSVTISADGVLLSAVLGMPRGAGGVVVFAHGSGAGCRVPGMDYVARCLQSAGVGTLVVDLLTPEEMEADRHTAELGFDIDLLARRIAGARDWLRRHSQTQLLPAGYFATGACAAAALVSAARKPDGISAVVCCGGRPEMAGASVRRVHAPTLFVVGGEDEDVLQFSREALADIHAIKKLHVVPGAHHGFAEPGALHEVSLVSVDWFTCFIHLPPEASVPAERVSVF
jgi:dienelactone hydrolase